MYRLDDNLPEWIENFSIFVDELDPKKTDYEMRAFIIMYEAATELYQSILQSGTTNSIKAILTRTLIECYADVFSVFRNEDSAKQAKKYVKYAEKLNRLFSQQATNYVSARDNGEVTTRAFQLVRSYQACWNGMNVTARVKNIDGGRHVIGYYEFFSLFAHVNPSRELYLEHFKSPVIAYYNSYIMLLILQTFVTPDFIPEKYFISLNKIAADYSTEYVKTDDSPPYPDV